MTSHESLDTRHKITLHRFAAKCDWINDKITVLEARTLPTLDDLEDVTDDATLDGLWDEHDEIEREANALDQGDLRSLRQLAKAASQKDLSPEDTDLIEVTLNTLFALDKLLHLLRQRNTTLNLLETRIKWNMQLHKIDQELRDVTMDSLPKFIEKCRWKPPNELPASRSSTRLPTSDSQSSLRSSASSSSLSKNAASSAMTRQMRSEILSLDLASLSSRIRTLQYSSLPPAGRFLDQMIDLSPQPLPERYLDKQDDLEAQVKREVDGLVTFCADLNRQWKVADEVWHKSVEHSSVLDELARDVLASTLKTPNTDLALAYERRLAAVSSSVDTLSKANPKDLPHPAHPTKFSDQHDFSEALKRVLDERVATLRTKLDETRQVVHDYSRAVDALRQAETFKADAIELSSDLKQVLATIEPPRIDESLLTLGNDLRTEDDLLAALQGLESMVDHANAKLLPQAPQIQRNLLASGIDPNLRKEMQDCAIGLSTGLMAAKASVQACRHKMQCSQSITSLVADFDDLEHKVQAQHALVRQQIIDHLDHGAGSLPSTQLPPLSFLDERLANQAKKIDSINQASTGIPSLGEPGVEGHAILITSLRDRQSDLQQRANKLANLTSIAQQLQKQALSYRSNLDEHASIKERFQAFAKDCSALDGCPDREAMEALSSRHRHLVESFNKFVASMSESIPFIASSAVTETLPDIDLQQHDQKIRHQANGLVSALGALKDRNEEILAFLNATLHMTTASRDLHTSVESIQVRSGTLHAISDLESRLSHIKLYEGELQHATSSISTIIHPTPPSLIQACVSKDAVASQTATLSLAKDLADSLCAMREAVEQDLRDLKQKEVESQEREAKERASTLAQQRLDEELKMLQNELQMLVTEAQSVRDDVHEATGTWGTTDWLKETDDAMVYEMMQQTQDKLLSRLSSLLEKAERVPRKTDAQLYMSTYKSDAISSTMLAVEEERQAVKDLLQEVEAGVHQAVARVKIVREELRLRVKAEEESRRTIDQIVEDITTQEAGLLRLSHRLDGSVTIEEVNAMSQELSAADDSFKASEHRRKLDGLPSELVMSVDLRERVGAIPEAIIALQRRRAELSEALHSRLHALEEVEAQGTISISTGAVLPEDRSQEDVPGIADDSKAIARSHLATSSASHGGQDETSSEDLQPSKTHQAAAQTLAAQDKVEDVFGPEIYRSSETESLETTTPSLVAEGSSRQHDIQHLQDVQQALLELSFEDALRPTKTTSPARLPTVEEAESAQRQVSLLHAHLEDLSAGPTDDALVEIRTSVDRLLQSKTNDSTTLVQLAIFRQTAEDADLAFSDLLEIIDQRCEDASVKIDERLQAAKTALTRTKDASSVVQSDFRVARKLDQLETTYRDLEDMAQRESSHETRSASARSRVSSTSSHLSDHPTRAVSAQQPERVSSSSYATATPRNKSAGPSRIPMASPRVGTSTASTPRPNAMRLPRKVSLSNLDSRRSPLLPLTRKSSREANLLATPSSSKRTYLTDAALQLPSARRSSTRRSSSAFSLGDDTRPNAYRPDTKRKLDVAVSRIVNNMNVPVNIVSADSFQDESGKYWIGSPEPKLYFARILRSKTVMLRVGGGWQELGSFLSTHFDHLFQVTSSSASSSSSKATSPTLSGSTSSWLSPPQISERLSSSSTFTRANVEVGPRKLNRRASSDNRNDLLRSQSFQRLSESKFDPSNLPSDLTSLLVKSAARSPPVGPASYQARNKSAPIPWRV